MALLFTFFFAQRSPFKLKQRLEERICISMGTCFPVMIETITEEIKILKS